MRSSDSSTYPVTALKERATDLEAAVLECLEKPGKKAVHKVRTTTRRIEAQLIFLGIVGSFPAYEHEAAKLSKVLKKLRRAAGAVRDLDVQLGLVAKEAESLAAGGAKEARKLERWLRGHRDKEAEKLQTLLKGLRVRLPRRVEALLNVLEPAEATAVEERRLARLVREWYRPRAAPLQDGALDDPERLHGVRKLAKLARYLAETAPEGAVSVHALADRFEGIQEAGGQWHDWMILAEVAAGELGDSAALPQRFSVHAATALDEFRKKLGAKI